VVPKFSAVTKPVELIVATAVLSENHGVVAVIGAGGKDAINCVVLGPGKQMLKFPVITFACKEATVKIVTIRK
jgi:hypothetical protein